MRQEKMHELSGDTVVDADKGVERFEFAFGKPGKDWLFVIVDVDIGGRT